MSALSLKDAVIRGILDTVSDPFITLILPHMLVFTGLCRPLLTGCGLWLSLNPRIMKTGYVPTALSPRGEPTEGLLTGWPSQWSWQTRATVGVYLGVCLLIRQPCREIMAGHPTSSVPATVHQYGYYNLKKSYTSQREGSQSVFHIDAYICGSDRGLPASITIVSSLLPVAYKKILK